MWDFSRNTLMYQAFEDFPYGSARAVRDNDFHTAENVLKEDLNDNNKKIESYKNAIATVSSVSTNAETAQVVINEIYSIQENIRILEESNEELKEALYNCHLMERLEQDLYAGIEVNEES